MLPIHFPAASVAKFTMTVLSASRAACPILTQELFESCAATSMRGLSGRMAVPQLYVRNPRRLRLSLFSSSQAFTSLTSHLGLPPTFMAGSGNGVRPTASFSTSVGVRKSDRTRFWKPPGENGDCASGLILRQRSNVLLLTLSLLQMSSADNNMVCEMSISPIEPSELSQFHCTVMRLNASIPLNTRQNAFYRRLGGFGHHFPFRELAPRCPPAARRLACATGILDRAEQGGEHQGALGAIREVRGCLELLGKLNGELRTSASAIAVASTEPHKVRTLDDFYSALAVKARLTGKSEPSDVN